MNDHPAPVSPAAPVSVAVNPHYQQLGGEQVLRQLVDRFYQLMDELPQAASIRAMHPPDLTHSKERLFMFLSGWLGGPPLYAERYGQPRLRRAHLSFPVDVAARDAWLECMSRALQELPLEAVFREQLLAAFAKTADFMRNQ